MATESSETPKMWGCGAAVSTKEHLDHIELLFGMVYKSIKTLLAGAPNRDIVVGVCYSLTHQKEKEDKGFFWQLVEASWPQAPALVGDFNHSGRAML